MTLKGSLAFHGNHEVVSVFTSSYAVGLSKCCSTYLSLSLCRQHEHWHSWGIMRSDSSCVGQVGVLYVPAYAWRVVYLCAYVEPEVNVSCFPASVSNLYFETVCYKTWSLPFQLGWLASKSPGSVCLHHPSAGP